MDTRDAVVAVQLDGSISDAQQEIMLRVIKNQNIAAMEINVVRLEALKKVTSSLFQENAGRKHFDRHLQEALDDLDRVNESRAVGAETEELYFAIDPTMVREAMIAASAAAIADVMTRVDPPANPSN